MVAPEPTQAQIIAEAEFDTTVDDLRKKLSTGNAEDSMVTSAGAIDGSEPMRDVSRIEYIPLYNTRDGRKVDVLPSMLRAKLSLKWRPDQEDVPLDLIGLRVWSVNVVEKPSGTQNLVCSLHKESPLRSIANTLGIDTICRRVLLPNKMALRRHMKGRHPTENDVLLEYKQDRKDEANTALQQANLEAMQSLAAQGGVTPAPIDLGEDED